MKKILLGIILTLGLCSCENMANNDTIENIEQPGIRCEVKIINIKEHEYIVASYNSYDTSGSGISIIHSESCQCKNKNNVKGEQNYDLSH